MKISNGLLFVLMSHQALLSQNSDKPPTENQHPAKLVSASTVRIAQDTEAYLVNVAFDFPGRAIVNLRDIGNVPSPGHYQFITKQTDLVFRDILNGHEIDRVPIVQTTVTAARPPLDILPTEHQFPEPFRSFRLSGSTPFQASADTVLGRYFNYFPKEAPNHNSITTTFTELPLAKTLTDAGVVAQLALLVSFPFDPNSSTYNIHVQTLIQEGRALSDQFRPTSNPEIIRSANSFVDHLIDDLRKEEKQ